MSTRNWSCASICTAALLLCATASAQWTSRYDFAASTDESNVVAVDHEGNVFVAGKVATAFTGYDFFVISYDSSGVERWHATYDGPVSGDDIATAIAVDWQGNCYVAGVSAGGSISRQNDFAVIKYDNTGHTVWPNSVTRTGYDFYNGAIRMSDYTSDGTDHNGKYVCSISMEDIDSDQPTFAISGPTGVLTVGGFITKWRTVVFEADATDGVRVKNGWPVDEYGTINADTAYGVAIAPDDSVYVTGGVHTSSTVEEFYTVRYKPDGTASSGNIHYWIDTWTDYSGKPSSGRAIALDYDGNAYVTGVLLAGATTTEIGTRKIEKDPSSGTTPVDDWSTIYHPTESAEPAGISLSFEVESGPVLNPHVYVTGKKFEPSSSTNHDIVTLRYNGTSGTDEWSGPDIRGSSSQDDVGLSVVGAGRGNVYVAGRKNNDLIVFALDKTGSARYTYTFDNGGADEARSVAMGGAGLVYYTGPSFATGHDLDFLTGSRVESASSCTPNDYHLLTGTTSSSVSDVASTDSNWFTISDSGGKADVYFTGDSGDFSLSSLTELSIKVRGPPAPVRPEKQSLSTTLLRTHLSLSPTKMRQRAMLTLSLP